MKGIKLKTGKKTLKLLIKIRLILSLFAIVGSLQVGAQQMFGSPLSEGNDFPDGAFYQDTNLSPSRRAENVISYLTFDESMELIGGWKNYCFP